MTAVQLKPLQPLAAEASGIDISKPLNSEQVRAIEQAMDTHAVLVFRDQPLTEDQQIGFAKSFGPLDLGLRKLKGGPHRFKHAELADISNVLVDGSVAARDHAQGHGQQRHAVPPRVVAPLGPAQWQQASPHARQ